MCDSFNLEMMVKHRWHGLDRRVRGSNPANNDHGHVSNHQLNNQVALATNEEEYEDEFAVENSILELISEVEEHSSLINTTTMYNNRLHQGQEQLDYKVIAIQRIVRGYLLRKAYTTHHTSAIIIQQAFRYYKLYQLTTHRESSLLIRKKWVQTLPKDLIQALRSNQEMQTLCGHHDSNSVDLSTLRTLARKYNVLQSQNYLEYHSAILTLLNSMLREMTLNKVDVKSQTFLNMQIDSAAFKSPSSQLPTDPTS